MLTQNRKKPDLPVPTSHRMVALVNTYGYPLDEMASGLGQPNAARMTLAQEDAEVFFQCLHAGADAGLCNAGRVGGVTEVEIFGDSESVNYGHHWHSPRKEMIAQQI